MRARRLRRLIGTTLATTLAAAIVGSGAVAGTSATAATKPAVSPVGAYTAVFPAEGRGSELDIRPDQGVSQKEGSWSLLAFGDNGTWVVEGTTIALFDVNGPDAGMVLLGTVGQHNIQGSYGRTGFGYATWGATLGTKPTLTHARGTNAAIGSQARGVGPAAKPAGTYTAKFPGGPRSSGLTITNDTHISNQEGTFVLARSGDTGNWVVMGKHYAMGVTGSTPNSGTVYIGTLTAGGISSAAKPGLYGRPASGINPWYATRAAASASPASPAVSAVGTYQATFTPGVPSQLVISSDTGFSKNEGTFTLTDFGDTGSWVISGSTISMIITTSSGGDRGIVLIGTVAATGISPGNFGLPGYAYGSWSATKAGKPRHARSHGSSIVGARHARAVLPVPPAAKAARTYSAQFPDFSQSDTLTITNDVPFTKEGTFSLSSFGDSGNWVVMGKHFAMGVLVGINAGYVFVGKLGSTGISSPATPGRIGVPGAGTFRWYATKA